MTKTIICPDLITFQLLVSHGNSACMGNKQSVILSMQKSITSSLCWFACNKDKRNDQKELLAVVEGYIWFLVFKQMMKDSDEATWPIYLTIFTTEACMMSVKPELNFIPNKCLFWMLTLRLRSTRRAPNVMLNQPENWTTALVSLNSLHSLHVW